MIKIASAECFTYGKIGLELHRLSQNYTGNFGPEYIEYENIFKNTSVICSLFIPTISAVKTILKIPNPPQPKQLIKDIKVYDEKGDKKVSKLMAKAVKDMTKSDIGIGTTAGIGKGAISIQTNKYLITTNSGFYADLVNKNSKDLHQRQIAGIKKGLKIMKIIL